MQILHLNLLPQGADHAELRFYTHDPYIYESRSLPLADIADLLAAAETEVYVPAAMQDLVTTGKRLYQWLDGRDRWLSQVLGQPSQGTVLAIAASGGLANLPWEVLHDGASYLVQQLPSVVPVRWAAQVRSGTVSQLQPRNDPQNRALNLMFMATSPRGVQPVLHFEQEEARILAATERQPIALLVEESGNLEELGYALTAYGAQHSDGLHLTGHATLRAGEPRFVMETATGDPQYVSATDMAQTLQGYLPPLLFLSGCRTGEGAQAGAVPSMAEALLAQGATAVLGWGQKVLDTDATEAAATLYGALSQGKPLALALAETYRRLLEGEARDWHLLRLYVANQLPESLVTALRTPGRRPAPPPSTVTEFLDPVTQQVKVVGRRGFVGRRRQLQACLRVLTQAPDKAGVLIHGMGGLGKSTLAARLCDRLPETQRLVWVGRLDEQALIRRFSEALDDPGLRAMLQDPKEALRYRLRRLFQAVYDQGRTLLLVLDDFEDDNLTTRNDTYVPTDSAAQLLTALLWALEQTAFAHKLIITSRYDFEFSGRRHLVPQPLEALHGADLQKKCNSLEAFQPLPAAREGATTDPAIAQHQQRAQQLADGNPRLLEWLDKLLLEGARGGVDVDAVLARLAAAGRQELREHVLAATLLAQMDAAMQTMLQRGLVFELPVPRAAFEAICRPPSSPSLGGAVGESPPVSGDLGGTELGRSIAPAIALGLLEVSPAGDLRVPRRSPLALPEETAALNVTAAQTLYRLWWETDEGISEEQALELVRLGLLARDEDIAVKVGDRIATRWVSTSRYAEVIALCQTILAVFDNDYRILGTRARAEVVVGLVSEALDHYQLAAVRCPEADLERKAATFGNMARVIAAQGRIEEAMELWRQSLELKEQINDVQGKAATFNNMARVIAAQGRIEEAMELWRQSLELKEQINDVQGKAATLANMAYIAGETGDKTRQLTLNLQAAQALTQSRAFGDLFTVLSNLGLTAAAHADAYLAQALWLTLRIQTPLSDTLALMRYLFNQVPQGDGLEALLAATALFFCRSRGERHPQIEQLQQSAMQLLAAAAAQGVETQAAFAEWFTQPQLNDLSIFIPQLNQRLEVMIGDQWLFDPN